FFGSRLMKNIREDKGYTYGIHSSISSFDGCSLLTVIADVKKAHYKEAVNEIFNEIERLQNEVPAAEELDMLKSYLKGSMIHQMDQVTSLAGMFISLNEKDAGMDYYKSYFDVLGSISPQEIKETAQKYLTKESFYTVVSGV